jgi:hypothetical protein
MTKLLDDSGLNVIFDECNFVKKTMMNFNWWLQKTFLRAQFLYD